MEGFKTEYVARASTILQEEVGGASLDSDDRGGYYLLGIDVKPEYQGQGYGSRMLREITEEADKAGVVLWLDVLALSLDVDSQELIAWYERHGFTLDRGSRSCIEPMTRLPQQTKVAITKSREPTN